MKTQRHVRLLDHNVFCYHIENISEQARSLCATDKIYHAWVKACWSILLNRAPDAMDNQPVFTIVVDDSKVSGCYWRHHYLRAWLATHFPEAEKEKHEYKGGRKEKTTNFNGIKAAGISYIQEASIPYLSLPGYEADDLMAYFVKEIRALQTIGEETPHLHLHTIDCDLMQLIGPDVTWVNSGPWVPRIRDFDRALDYLNKKGKIKVGTKKKLDLKDGLTHPEQIVDVKVIEGDKSDSLFAGMAPRQVIDLLNPPTEFDLFYSSHRQWLRSFLVEQGMDNRNLEKYAAAREFIFRRGLPCPFGYSETGVG